LPRSYSPAAVPFLSLFFGGVPAKKTRDEVRSPCSVGRHAPFLFSFSPPSDDPRGKKPAAKRPLTWGVPPPLFFFLPPVAQDRIIARRFLVDFPLFFFPAFDAPKAIGLRPPLPRLCLIFFFFFSLHRVRPGGPGGFFFFFFLPPLPPLFFSPTDSYVRVIEVIFPPSFFSPPFPPAFGRQTLRALRTPRRSVPFPWSLEETHRFFPCRGDEKKKTPPSSRDPPWGLCLFCLLWPKTETRSFSEERSFSHFFFFLFLLQPRAAGPRSPPPPRDEVDEPALRSVFSDFLFAPSPPFFFPDSRKIHPPLPTHEERAQRLPFPLLGDPGVFFFGPRKTPESVLFTGTRLLSFFP